MHPDCIWIWKHFQPPDQENKRDRYCKRCQIWRNVAWIRWFQGFWNVSHELFQDSLKLRRILLSRPQVWFLRRLPHLMKLPEDHSRRNGLKRFNSKSALWNGNNYVTMFHISWKEVNFYKVGSKLAPNERSVYVRQVWVCQGFIQRDGIDFIETFASVPTFQYSGIWLILLHTTV